MWNRKFSKTKEDMIALAVSRAAEHVKIVMQVLNESGQKELLKEASGAAGLISVAHAAYDKAIHEIEWECEVKEPFGQFTPSDFFPNFNTEEPTTWQTVPMSPPFHAGTSGVRYVNQNRNRVRHRISHEFIDRPEGNSQCQVCGFGPDDSLHQ